MSEWVGVDGREVEVGMLSVSGSVDVDSERVGEEAQRSEG